MTSPFTTLRTPTVTLPSSYGTWRQDVHAALLAMLDAFRAAASTSGIVHMNYHALPDSISGDMPFTYIGEFGAPKVEFSNQVRTTTFSGTLGYVDSIERRDALDDRINEFIDLMRDLFTLNINILPPGILAITSEETGPKELRQGQLVYGHAEIGWSFVVQEGYR